MRSDDSHVESTIFVGDTLSIGRRESSKRAITLMEPFDAFSPDPAFSTKTTLVIVGSVFVDNTYESLIHNAGGGSIRMESNCFRGRSMCSRGSGTNETKRPLKA